MSSASAIEILPRFTHAQAAVLRPGCAMQHWPCGWWPWQPPEGLAAGVDRAWPQAASALRPGCRIRCQQCCHPRCTQLHSHGLAQQGRRHMVWLCLHTPTGVRINHSTLACLSDTFIPHPGSTSPIDHRTCCAHLDIFPTPFQHLSNTLQELH